MRLLALCEADGGAPPGAQVRRTFDPRRVPAVVQLDVVGPGGESEPKAAPVRRLWFELGPAFVALRTPGA